jgi:hypothetical protein
MNEGDSKEGMNIARMVHLTAAELVGYRDRTLDQTVLARAEAHLNLCLICEESIELLRGELAALEAAEIAPKHLALIKGMLGASEGSRRASRSELAEPARPSQTELLAESLTQVVLSWQAYFGQLQPVLQEDEIGKEVWRLEGGSVLRAWAVLENNSDLTIHFYSNEQGLEGAHFMVGLGWFNQEIALERISGSEVYAKVVVPKQQQPKNLADITVEIV